MQKNKILSSVLAGMLLGFSTVSSVKAVDKVSSDVICYSEEAVEDLDVSGFENVDILGTKFDLSNVNPSVLQSVARVFNEINSGELSISKKNERLVGLKDLLNKYFKNPSEFVDFPVTLDLGPTTKLREEIIYVQSKINDLKAQQESIKLTRMAQKAIDDAVKELQSSIDYLSKWINYSLVNFKASEYKTTFCNYDDHILDDEDKNNKLEVRPVKFDGELINMAYSTNDYGKVFTVSINGDGTFDIKGDEIDLNELSDSIKKGLEFENIKIRDILKEIEAVKMTKVTGQEQKNRIKELEKQINDVKFYALAQELVLLNMEKDRLKETKLPQSEVDMRVKELNDEIDQRLQQLIKFKTNENYSIESHVGEEPTYFGYLFDDNYGFVVKAYLDEDNKVHFEDMENLTNEQKDKLKKLVKEEIDYANKRINEVSKFKEDLEKKESDKKYYLNDSMDKELRILNNNIKNFENILVQL